MTDIVTGLTTEEVNKLKEQGLDNIPVGNQSKTIGQIIAGNVFTYFNFVFAVFAALLILVRSYINMTFLPIILLNTILGIVQEIKAKIVLDRLTVVNAPRTKVIRDSAVSEVDSVTLVKGDVCIFTAGNQLSADAILAEGCVRVNEAMVTGESDEVIKNKGDILLSGSYIVSGECKAVLTQVGHKAYAARLALEAKAGRKKKKTDMMKSLDNLVKIIGVVIVPLGIIMYVQSHFFLGHTIKNSVVSMVASLVGMIPEGLYLLASVALVVSVKKLARSNVLVHEMNCVETLARVNVLCVDKTGTITRPDMSVSDVVFLKDNVGKLIAGVAGNMDDDNETMKAIKNYYHITGRDNSAERVYSFSSQNKYSGAVLDGRCYIFGAPEYVLLDTYAEYEDIFERYSGHGERILVFGECVGDPCGNIIEEAVNPYAFIILENEIRDTAKETFGYFASQGVDIVVISGDNPVTASKVAVRAGINNAENYIDATTLKSRQDIREAITKYTVFGRVVPSQKKEIIEAYKESGKVVAMTGDGVNDVLALKCADCSVAMASGSEAAAQAAQVVLLDSDFAHMPDVVYEGRRVVNNIQRSASLFLVKNIFSLLLSLFSVILMVTYPLEPAQVSLISMFTIGVPGFLLALEQNKDRIKGHFITNVMLKALPGGLTDVIAVGALVVCGEVFCISDASIGTIATLVLSVVGFMILFKISEPLNGMKYAVIIGNIAGLVFSGFFLKKLFALTDLSNICILLMIVFGFAAESLFRNLTLLVEKLRGSYEKKKGFNV